MENLPLVSVIIPTRNRKELLKMAISSVLEQTYKKLQIVIHDNNSSDGTFEYINDQLKDPRVEYYRVDHDLIMTDNWNTAFGYVKGKYFVRLDDDNILFNAFVEEAIKKIYEHKLDWMSYCPIVLDTNKRLYSIFKQEDSLNLLDMYQFAYIEFYALSDSNNTLYSTDMIQKVLSGSGEVYETTLPDRYLNYRIANKIDELGLRVGLSTKVMGVTRYDYRQRYKDEYEFRYVDYSRILESNEVLRSPDCQSNFQMHRVYSLFYFFKNHKAKELQNYFDKHVLSESNYLCYVIIGHLNESKEEFGFSELLAYNRMAFWLLKNELKNSHGVIDGIGNKSHFWKQLRNSLVNNARSVRNILLRRKRKGDVLDVEFGNNICKEIIGGSEAYRDVESKWSYDSKVVEAIAANRSVESVK